MNKPILFYDCGELGWSLYLLGHLNWLIRVKNNKNISVCTYRNRRFLYEHLPIEVLTIPYGISQEIKGLDMDGTHLFRHDIQERVHNRFLTKLFNDYYGDKYEIFENYSKFFDESLYESLESGIGITAIANAIIEYKKCILVFPRKRKGKFGQRNLPEKFYINLINRIHEEFEDIKIISIGLPSSSYKLSNSILSNRFIDLTQYDKDCMLELLFALLNTGKVICSIGSQSALPKISLLQKVSTYMIGHEEARHTKTDNWMNTKCGFYVLDRSYVINIDNCINHFIKWVKS
jgi:hypothetical protein